MSSTSSFMDKTYKTLFILYAPIAVVTFIMKFYTGSQMSYFKLTVLGVAGGSILLAIAILITYVLNRNVFMHDHEATVPYILRHKFLILYIFITLISCGLSILYLMEYEGSQVNLRQDPSEITEIVALIPITNDLNQPWESTRELVQGLSWFFVDHPKVSRRFHISFIDHKNKYGEKLKQIVAEEIDQGVRYFVCLYSHACVPLSKQFQSIVQASSQKDHPPILIVTATSSSEVKTMREGVYRFSPRNQELIHELVQIGKSRKNKRASYIAIDDAYGRNAVSLFIEMWNGEGRGIVPGLYLNPSLSKKNARLKIEKHFSTIADLDVVLVAHTENITDGLLSIQGNPEFLITPGYQKDFIKTISNDAKGIQFGKWYSVETDYKQEGIMSNKLSLDFFYLALDKLTHTIIETNGDPAKFHAQWMSTDYPPILNFERASDADFKIKLEPLDLVSPAEDSGI